MPVLGQGDITGHCRNHISPQVRGRTLGRGVRGREWGFLGEVSDYLKILDRHPKLYYELSLIVVKASPSID